MGGLVGQKAFNDTFDTPSPTIIGLIVSILEIGAFIGCLFTAAVGEQLGRKKSIAIGVVVMIIGSILQATAFHRAHLIVARVIAGKQSLDSSWHVLTTSRCRYWIGYCQLYSTSSSG